MEHSQHRFKIVCDVEVSGNCPIRNGVISACFLIIDDNLKVVDEFIRYVKPPNMNRKHWSLDAQKVHGMTFEQVEKFIPNNQFCFELLCFLKKYLMPEVGPIPFICHASPSGWFDPKKGEWIIIRWFDYYFIEWCFRKAFFSNGTEMVWTMFKAFNSSNLISTVQMAREVGYSGNKLNQWAERLGINLNHHDAKSDTYACLETYKFLIGRPCLN